MPRVLKPRDIWKNRVKAHRNRLGAWFNQLGIHDRDFSVISNDCWAEALYEDWNLPCKTPFRGLGMTADCYLQFLSDLERYLSAPLQFVSRSASASVNRLRDQKGSWPLGLIGGDVEIHFLHFVTQQEARRVWEEGCRSVNRDRIAVKFTIDKDGAEPRHVDQFARLPFERKLLISRSSYPELSCAVYIPTYDVDGGLMFRRSLRYFDCGHWLNTGEVRRRTLRVLINKLIYLRGV